MVCPKCQSDKVTVQMVQDGATSRTKGKGCLTTMFRWLLICCTLGLWLVFGKKKAKTKTSYSNKKIAVCSNCGNSWKV